MKKINKIITLAVVFILVSFCLFVSRGYCVAEIENQFIPAETYPSSPKDMPEPAEKPYVEGKIFIKLKEDVGFSLEKAKQGKFNLSTDKPSLNELSEEYVLSAELLFKSLMHTDAHSGKITLLSSREQAEIIKQKFPQRTARAPKNAVVPELNKWLLLHLKPGITVEKAISAYEADPNIEYAQPCYKAELDFLPNDPYYSSSGAWGQSWWNSNWPWYPTPADMYGMHFINTEDAWDISTGEGITVAVIDTGLDYNHPDIQTATQSNVWQNLGEDADGDGRTLELVNGAWVLDPGDINNIDDDNNGFIDDLVGWDFGSPSNGDNNPMDYSGHGTHVSGTVSAIGNNNTGVVGLAYNSKIMPLKGWADFNIIGYIDNLIRGIYYAVNNGADVLSNSWGFGAPLPSYPPLEEAVLYAYNLGCIVVFSAGNSNDNVMNYCPQNMDEVITVTASNWNDERATLGFFTTTPFSNWGEAIDVAAPGAFILSLRAAGTGSIIIGENYTLKTGTSMACPHVSGLAALILSDEPDLSFEQVRQKIIMGADDIEGPGWDPYTGYGRINAYQALLFEPTIYVPEDYTTIQEAINAAVSGQSVFVFAGTYVENITMKTGVNVSGEDRETTIITTANTNNLVTFENVDNCSISGFTLMASSSNQANLIYLHNSQDVSLYDNIIKDSLGGVVIDSNTTSTIRNNIIRDIASSAITTSNNADNVTTDIRNNVISFNIKGVTINLPQPGSYVSIINNVIYANNSVGIETKVYPVDNSVWIKNNIISLNYEGIYRQPATLYVSIFYNNLWGNYTNYVNCSAGVGGISADPVFRDPLNGDFKLGTPTTLSPCIDTGDPNSIYNDPDGSRNDMGVYGGPFGSSYSIYRTVPTEYPTIQGAIDAANSGDTIVVLPGTYEITQGITVDKSLIISSLEGAENTIIHRDQAALNDYVFRIYPGYTGDTILEGFTLTADTFDGLSLVKIEGCETPANHPTVIIRNNILPGPSAGSGSSKGINFDPTDTDAVRQTVSITNNIISGFSSGIRIDTVNSNVNQQSLQVEIINNTIVDNYINISILSSSAIQIKNSIIYDAVIPTYNISVSGSSPLPLVTYSDVEGGWTGVGGLGNINADPLFVGSGNYHLQVGSPCIDTGDPNPIYNDPDGTRNDMGGYGGPAAAGWDEPNQPPVISPIEPITVIAGQTAEVTISAIDPEGEQVTFSLSEQPVKVGFIDYGNGTAGFRVQTTPAMVNNTYTLFVTASDGELTSNATIVLNVVRTLDLTNQLPVNTSQTTPGTSPTPDSSTSPSSNNNITSPEQPNAGGSWPPNSGGQTQVSYTEGQIIIKLKEGAQFTLQDTGQGGYSLLTNKSTLNELTEEYVLSTEPLFKSLIRTDAITGEITILSSKAQAEIIKQQFPIRTARAPKNVVIPELNKWLLLYLKEGVSTEEAISAYQADTNIEYALLNYKAELSLTPNDPYYSSSGAWTAQSLWYNPSWPWYYENVPADMYGMHFINTEDAWDITTGSQDIVVAVIDTGLDYNHQDILGNVWINEDEIPGNGLDDDNNGYIDDIRGWDFAGASISVVDPDNDPMDYYGHGTHVAGTIAAVGNNDLGVVGVTWNSKIMPAKGFPDNMTSGGSLSDLINCIYYAADNGADVLSNSWGSGGPLPSYSPLEEAVLYAYNLGCVVVFAAGNSNANVMNYSPQNMDEVITVAASDYNEQRASFSNWGDAIAVAAPGVDILSLRAAGTGYEVFIVDEYYYYASGTSMACPHVAGLAALILSYQPTLTNELLRLVVTLSADDLGSAGWDPYFGYGRINAYQALLSSDIIYVPEDYPTIQEAINAAVGSMQIITVSSGTYEENITMRTGIYLIGENKETTIITAANPGNLVTFEEADNCTLTGFTLSSSQANAAYIHNSQGISIFDNIIEESSQGILLGSNTQAIIRNNLIRNIETTAITTLNSSFDLVADIKNNTIESNEKGISIDVAQDSNISIINNTLYANTNRGIEMLNIGENSNVVIKNNIITFSYAGIHNHNTTSYEISYNDAWGNYANFVNCSQWLGNISVDPVFRDPANGDFKLGTATEPLSPCVDTGDPNSIYNDPDGTRNDMGAYGGEFGSTYNRYRVVPTQYGSIQEAINAANAGDTISVLPGTYTISEAILVYKDLTITSLGGAENTTIHMDYFGGTSLYYCAIGFFGNVTDNTILQGFTIISDIGRNIVVYAGATPIIRNNILLSGPPTGMGISVGAIDDDLFNGVNVSISNNIISGFYSGIRCDNNFGSSYPLPEGSIAPVEIVNNVIVNSSSFSGVYTMYPILTPIKNCIIYNNSPDAIYAFSNGSASVAYSDFGTTFGPISLGVGNINLDPMFVDLINGDYHLLLGSPCIDTGDPDLIYNDPDGSRNDMGAYGGPEAEGWEPNQSPVITPIAPITVIAGQTAQGQITASDPQGEPITLTLSEFSAKVHFQDNGNGTADFRIETNSNMVNHTYAVFVIANDGELTSSAPIVLHVVSRVW